jgi:hypothetical protein
MKTTQHTCGGPIFGRLTDGCPRCTELSNGADPIRWHIRNTRKEKEAFRHALRMHDCKKSGCGPVCTAFDW